MRARLEKFHISRFARHAIQLAKHAMGLASYYV